MSEMYAPLMFCATLIIIMGIFLFSLWRLIDASHMWTAIMRSKGKEFGE
jgi:high-affinity Fe2+/Pb2+ permease